MYPNAQPSYTTTHLVIYSIHVFPLIQFRLQVGGGAYPTLDRLTVCHTDRLTTIHTHISTHQLTCPHYLHV